MNGYIHDQRHRCSLEVRPDAALDATLRSLARDLEARGLLRPGATTAARFHPHLTLLRASAIPAAVVAHAAATLHAPVSFSCARTFGDGRIVYLAPDDCTTLIAVRGEAMSVLDADTLDPLATSRPWTPHVTLAYVVPEAAREAALELVCAALPVSGAWESVQAWDLDVRPTLLLDHVPIA